MFETIVRDHLRRYPALQIQDVYKLIHQAVLGSGHAVPDSESARHRLERELAEMGEGPAEPLFDPLSADGSIVRVHLRPYAASGGRAESLLDAFVRTAERHRGEAEQVERYWHVVRDLARHGQLPFELGVLDGFFRPLETKNFPALHHSPEFESRYRPAYRVIRKEFLTGDTLR